MLTEAVAAYFRELRAGRGFTQETLATTVEVGKRTIERLERNEGDVSVESFERIIAVLGASPDEVNYLVTHPSATVDEAKELARTLLQRDPSLRWATPRVTSHYQDSVSTGIQMYVRTLRESQRIARKALADVMGVSIAAYADWEAGRGNDIPLPTLVRAITHLGGTLEDLDQIAMASDGHEALGRRLADERIAAAQMHRGAVNGHRCCALIAHSNGRCCDGSRPSKLSCTLF